MVETATITKVKRLPQNKISLTLKTRKLEMKKIVSEKELKALFENYLPRNAKSKLDLEKLVGTEAELIIEEDTEDNLGEVLLSIKKIIKIEIPLL